MWISAILPEVTCIITIRITVIVWGRIYSGLLSRSASAGGGVGGLSRDVEGPGTGSSKGDAGGIILQ